MRSPRRVRHEGDLPSAVAPGLLRNAEFKVTALGGDQLITVEAATRGRRPWVAFDLGPRRSSAR